MRTIKIYELLQRRVLVTRGSAREIEPELVAALVEGQGEVEIDLFSVGGLTPSFFDETLAIFEEKMADTNGEQFRLTVRNPPTQLSSKFVAVGRGHGLTVTESESGAWIISKRG